MYLYYNKNNIDTYPDNFVIMLIYSSITLNQE
nr:MAG TPA: hypothetical protein [Caudoviricetes sp.]